MRRPWELLPALALLAGCQELGKGWFGKGEPEAGEASGGVSQEATAATEVKSATAAPAVSKSETPREHRLHHADALFKLGKYQEAVNEYLWVLDHGSDGDEVQDQIRLSYVLGSLIDLADQVPTTWDELTSRRDRHEDSLLGGDGSWMLGMELAALNEALGEPEATLDVYEQLKELRIGTSRMRSALLASALAGFVESMEYEELLGVAVDVLSEFHDRVSRYESLARPLAVAAGARTAAREDLLLFGGRAYEALLGMGKQDEAEKVADRILSLESGATTYARLIQHAVRAGDRIGARDLVERALRSVSEAERPVILEAAAALRRVPLAPPPEDDFNERREHKTTTL
jgi:hypothetical protein